MRANENHLSSSSSSIDGPIKKIKYLIIGGGAAGFSAIQAILENDSNSNSQVNLELFFIAVVCSNHFSFYFVMYIDNSC